MATNSSRQEVQEFTLKEDNELRFEVTTFFSFLVFICQSALVNIMPSQCYSLLKEV